MLVIASCFQTHTGKTGIGIWGNARQSFTRVFSVQAVSDCCEVSHGPKGMAEEHKSNCRSKLSMHLNSLFPEKDKDTELRAETLKMNNSLAGVFSLSFPLQSSVTLLSQLKNSTTFSKQIEMHFSCVNKCPEKAKENEVSTCAGNRKAGCPEPSFPDLSRLCLISSICNMICSYKISETLTLNRCKNAFAFFLKLYL